jgi:hypothetical protein
MTQRTSFCLILTQPRRPRTEGPAGLETLSQLNQLEELVSHLLKPLKNSERDLLSISLPYQEVCLLENLIARLCMSLRKENSAKSKRMKR